MYKKLSVLIPVYNEKNTIKDCLDAVLKADIGSLDLEVIISDNNSNDGTKEILSKIDDPRVKILYRERNNGKGANIKNALMEANGDLILFQDGDLEYSPNDYIDLIEPFLKFNADVVYGSRLTRAKVTSIVGFPNYIGNILFTFLTNMLFNKIFTDIATGYKVFKKDIIKDLEIISDGFEIEPEITAKISRNKNIKIFEVPISINSRGYEEGKKVKWWHFFTYIYCIIKWRFKD
ncbi:glycosyltransferase family 2 protein [Candidatus Pelagibacter sp.]|jgi:glycosyltransferase involved in cell wall biosynthesis|nr:glycosyltransferase family 2 protein [Candidatus Pelagibacter sp.]